MDIVDHSAVYRRGPGRLCLENPARFVQADALEFMRDVIEGKHGHFDLVCASPPCQAHSTLRHLQAGKVYPDLIEPTRELLQKWGGLWCIENVPGAPLGRADLTMLCGSMFGLQTPDGRAELRRHRLFETSFSIPLRPACQHGHEALSVCGSGLDSGMVCVGGGKAMSGGMSEPQGMRKRRAISVTGSTPQTNVVHNQERETFSTADARAAMGIDWMAMKQLSQAIPPVYAEWVGRQARAYIGGQAP